MPGEDRQLLFDLVMPYRSGSEAYRQIRELDPEVKVMFTSGYSENDLDSELVGPGEVVLLQKPYSPHTLLVEVRTLLDR